MDRLGLGANICAQVCDLGGHRDETGQEGEQGTL